MNHEPWNDVNLDYTFAFPFVFVKKLKSNSYRGKFNFINALVFLSLC